MGKYRVFIDRSFCIDCGIATGKCPTHSRMLARIFVNCESPENAVAIIPESLYDRVKQAAAACPVKAIIIEKIEE